MEEGNVEMAEQGSSPRRQSGELEAAVLAALWSAGRAMTAADVQGAVGGSLARNTVATVLTRLHDKGTVGRGRTGRGYSYTPTQDAAGLAAARMHSELAKRGPERSAVLAHFVSRLSSDDEELLRRLLAEAEGPAGHVLGEGDEQGVGMAGAEPDPVRR